MKSNKLFIFIFLMTLSQIAQAESYIVKYKTPTLVQNLSAGAQIQMVHPEGSWVLVKFPAANSAAQIAELKRNPEVEYVVRNAHVAPFFRRTAEQPIALRPQYAVEKVQAAKAWQLMGNKGSRQIKVAVIDTGADYRHLSLAPNMIAGYNFIENNNDPMDRVEYNFPGHGTHCSGGVGATGKIQGGTTGLSPDVSLMPLRFINEEGGEVSNGIRAIDYAIEQKVDVMSASWGGRMSAEEAKPLVEAIARAEKAGIIFAVAAGNDSSNNDTSNVYPANAGLSNTISVGATNQDDERPDWSNYGASSVDISAPGEDILSTLPGNNYADMSGTSMATPLVAGALAFLKAQDASLSPSEFRSLLQASGNPVNSSTICNCRLNMYKAAQMIQQKTPFLSPYFSRIGSGQKANLKVVYGQAPFRFESSKPQVASVAVDGTISAQGVGETRITVTDASGRVSAAARIVVK